MRLTYILNNNILSESRDPRAPTDLRKSRADSVARAKSNTTPRIGIYKGKSGGKFSDAAVVGFPDPANPARLIRTPGSIQTVVQSKREPTVFQAIVVLPDGSKAYYAFPYNPANISRALSPFKNIELYLYDQKINKHKKSNPWNDNQSNSISNTGANSSNAIKTSNTTADTQINSDDVSNEDLMKIAKLWEAIKDNRETWSPIVALAGDRLERAKRWAFEELNQMLSGDDKDRIRKRVFNYLGEHFYAENPDFHIVQELARYIIVIAASFFNDGKYKAKYISDFIKNIMNQKKLLDEFSEHTLDIVTKFRGIHLSVEDTDYIISSYMMSPAIKDFIRQCLDVLDFNNKSIRYQVIVAGILLKFIMPYLEKIEIEQYGLSLIGDENWGYKLAQAMRAGQFNWEKFSIE